MKFLPALGLLPVLLLPIACASAPPTEQTGEKRAKIAGGSCTSSREDILASASAGRQQAIQRGFGWLDQNVPYSQSKSFAGYRTDCSGFVSMCWELGTSTTTAVLFGANQYASDLGSWDDLLPADALVHNGHVVLFLAWEPDKSGVCVLEQASTASDMQFRVRSVSSLKSQSFKPIRAAKLADDTAVAQDVSAPPATDPSTSDPSTAAPPAASDEPSPTDPSAPPPSDPAAPATCVSPADLDVCNEALLTRGIGCGVVVDGCGKTVNCDAVAGFGCKNGEKCNATSHQCEKGATSAPPPPAATAPAAPETPPISAQEGTVPPQGDPGDDGVSAPAARGPNSSKSATALPKSDVPSSGCSASPSKSAGRGAGDVLPLLAFAVAVSVARRRRRRS